MFSFKNLDFVHNCLVWAIAETDGEVEGMSSLYSFKTDTDINGNIGN